MKDCTNSLYNNRKTLETVKSVQFPNRFNCQKSHYILQPGSLVQPNLLIQVGQAANFRHPPESLPQLTLWTVHHPLALVLGSSVMEELPWKLLRVGQWNHVYGLASPRDGMDPGSSS